MPYAAYMTHKFDRALIPSKPTLSFEISLWGSGTKLIAGIDEAGRGPLAGPVSAAAIILPEDPSLCQKLHGVRDSKQMSPADRESWADILKREAISYGTGFASPGEIDGHGIIPATLLAVQRALAAMPVCPQHLLLDYLQLPDVLIPQTALIKGDARCLSIAAASVLAKTARDALMCEMDLCYPGYGFAKHKGYATQEHLRALERLGPCPIHRYSFSPIRREPEDIPIPEYTAYSSEEEK
jgi:ribonuclease HII